MKKFTSLFALLAVVFSVAAQPYQPTIPSDKTTIFFEKNISPYNYIYVYGGNGELAGRWPGTTIASLPSETINGHTVYRWTCDIDKAGQKIIFHEEENNPQDERIEQDFHDKGIYIDGVYDRIAGDNNVEGHTVYFDISEQDWWGGHDVYVYAWSQEHEAAYLAWPGVKMERIGTTNLYKGTIYSNDDNFKNLVFNWNKSDGSPTEGVDQSATISNENDGMVYTVTGLAGPANFTIYNTQEFTSNKNYIAASATYTRTSTSQWGTLCLPFTFKVAEQSNVNFYWLPEDGIDADNRSITFAHFEEEYVDGGQAVLFKLSSQDGTLNITANNGVTVTSEPQSGECAGLYGTFEEVREDNVYYISANQFYFGSNILIKPYRGFVAYAQGPSEQSGEGAPFRFTVDDTEDIQFVEQEDGTVKAYYDLHGRKLDSARKGLVIENGKIIMVK